MYIELKNQENKMIKFDFKRFVIKKIIIISLIIITGIVFSVLTNYGQTAVTPKNIDSSMQVMSGDLRTTDAMIIHESTGKSISIGRVITMSLMLIFIFILIFDIAFDIYKFKKINNKLNYLEETK